jgi:hypothetical protein
MFRTVIVGAVVLTGLIPGQAVAQAAGEQASSEFSMFSRGQYKGPRITANGARQAIDPAMTVRSVIIPPGSQWELCSGSTFTGCRQFAQSTSAMVMTVRSVRPVARVITSSGLAPATATATGPGQSLRGWASEFFVSPDTSGERIQIQTGVNEAIAERARDFCRSRGWRAPAHQRVQTVGQLSYLADVLCVDNEN